MGTSRTKQLAKGTYEYITAYSGNMYFGTLLSEGGVNPQGYLQTMMLAGSIPANYMAGKGAEFLISTTDLGLELQSVGKGSKAKGFGAKFADGGIDLFFMLTVAAGFNMLKQKVAEYTSANWLTPSDTIARSHLDGFVDGYLLGVLLTGKLLLAWLRKPLETNFSIELDQWRNKRHWAQIHIGENIGNFFAASSVYVAMQQHLSHFGAKDFAYNIYSPMLLPVIRLGLEKWAEYTNDADDSEADKEAEIIDTAERMTPNAFESKSTSSCSWRIYTALTMWYLIELLLLVSVALGTSHLNNFVLGDAEAEQDGPDQGNKPAKTLLRNLTLFTSTEIAKIVYEKHAASPARQISYRLGLFAMPEAHVPLAVNEVDSAATAEQISAIFTADSQEDNKDEEKYQL